jgi:hypothetical protein
MTTGRHLTARTVARPLQCYSTIVYMWVLLLFIIILVIPSVFIHRRVILRRMCTSLTVNHVAASRKFVAGFSLQKVGFNPTTMDTGIVVKKQHCDVHFSKYFGFPQLVFHQKFRTLWPMPGMENDLVRGHASRDYYHNKKTKIAEHKNLLSAAIGCFYNQNTRYRLP